MGEGRGAQRGRGTVSVNGLLATFLSNCPGEGSQTIYNMYIYIYEQRNLRSTLVLIWACLCLVYVISAYSLPGLLPGLLLE